MVGSAVGASLFPFELFLLAYAVLGPMHYLTEISWLHDRKYFARGKPNKRPKIPTRWLALVALTMVVMVVSFVAVEGAGVHAQPKWEITFFYLVFVSALFTSVIENRTWRIISSIVAVLLMVLFAQSRFYILIAFFLVTIVHVMVFTASFILYGALKQRSLSGILSVLVFIICAVGLLAYAQASHIPGHFVRASYRSFNALNAELMKWFGWGTGTSSPEIYESPKGLMVMRLIAFGYTYHYLNWFSKTSIIRWYEVPKSRTVAIVAVWLMALAIYAYDYDTGMAVLYFMSILHVMLEFPLNHRTFVGIGREVRSVMRPAFTSLWV
jgi:hypothetical protein